MHDLRCGGRLHAKVLDEQHLEVKCPRRACGAKPGVVVLHVFDIHTGELISTKTFADPAKLGSEEKHGSRKLRPSVRSS